MPSEKDLLIKMCDERVQECEELISEQQTTLKEAKAEPKIKSEVRGLIIAFCKSSIKHDKERKYYYELIRDSLRSIKEAELSHKPVYQKFLIQMRKYDKD